MRRLSETFWRISCMYTRAAATPRWASTRNTMLSSTNSKSEKRWIAPSMNLPYSVGPVSSNLVWRTSTTMGQSSRTISVNSPRARRVTTSAYRLSSR